MHGGGGVSEWSKKAKKKTQKTTTTLDTHAPPDNLAGKEDGMAFVHVNPIISLIIDIKRSGVDARKKSIRSVSHVPFCLLCKKKKRKKNKEKK